MRAVQKVRTFGCFGVGGELQRVFFQTYHISAASSAAEAAKLGLGLLLVVAGVSSPRPQAAFPPRLKQFCFSRLPGYRAALLVGPVPRKLHHIMCTKVGKVLMLRARMCPPRLCWNRLGVAAKQLMLERCEGGFQIVRFAQRQDRARKGWPGFYVQG